MTQIGRNDPCPCGSGKKYKKCCMVESVPMLGREDVVKKRHTQLLVQFGETHHKHSLKKAFERFWGDFSMHDSIPSIHHQSVMINFMEWFVHDRVMDEGSGKTLIDIYIEKTKLLGADDLSILKRMKDAVISLYEVREHYPDEGFLLKDLIQGEVYTVSEKMATRSLMKWDIFAARLLLLDGKYVIAGSLYPFQIEEKIELVGDIMKAFAAYIVDYPGSSLKDFLKAEAGSLFNHMWCDTFVNPKPIFLHNTSGDPMMISKAVFDIVHGEHLHEKLGNAKELERDVEAGNVYRWVGDTKNMENVTLGMITLSKGHLTLECNSKKRLAKGKKLVLKYLAGNVAHRVDSFEKPEDMIEDIRRTPPADEPDDDEIPADIAQGIYAEFMDKHNKDWVKMSIPALGGLTPLQAVKTKSGRMKVIELLKQFENSEEHNKRMERPHYDTSWMWKKLGLEKDKKSSEGNNLAHIPDEIIH